MSVTQLDGMIANPITDERQRYESRERVEMEIKAIVRAKINLKIISHELAHLEQTAPIQGPN